MLAVKTSDLTKKYGKYSGIESVNLLVEAGDIFGIVGSDGAGKTTLLRLLMNFIFPTSGTGNIFGFDVEKESSEVKEITGYVPADVTCYPYMKAGKYIKTAMKMHKIKDSKFYRELVTLFEIPEKETFSLMDRSDLKATGLCGALVLSPKVLLLDEPLKDLDKERKKVLFDYLKKRNEEGMTIIITEKDGGEIEDFCTRIATMQHGEITEIQENNGSLYTPIKEQEEEGETADISMEETTIIPDLPLENDLNDVVEAPIDESEFEAVEDAIEEPLSEEIEEEAEVEGVEEDETDLPEEESLPADYEEQSIEDFLSESEEEPKETRAETHGVAGQGLSISETIAETIKTADNIKVTAKRFNKKVFEDMGMAMISQEKGKVKLAYAGSVEDLAKTMQEMGFENYTISNPAIADTFLSSQQVTEDSETEPKTESESFQGDTASESTTKGGDVS